MSYAKIHEEYWDGEKIQPLSDRAALLGLFLLTGPHRNAIGCFRLGIGAITDIQRFGAWGIDGVTEAMNEMVRTGFIARDDKTGWTLVVNHLKKDPITNPKAAIHAIALAARVPRSSPVYRRLVEILQPQLEAHSKVLEGKPEWPMASPIEGASDAPSEWASKGHTKPQPSPLPIPSPLPEPEPDPIPEPEPERGGASQNAEMTEDASPDGSAPSQAPADDPPKTAEEADFFQIPQQFRRGSTPPAPGPEFAAEPPSGASASVSRVTRGTRLDPNWTLPDGWRMSAEQSREQHNLPPIDLALEAAQFRNYWTAKPGKDGIKLDWRATWINWALRSRAPAITHGGHDGRSSTGFGDPFLAAAAERARGAED